MLCASRLHSAAELQDVDGRPGSLSAGADEDNSSSMNAAPPKTDLLAAPALRGAFRLPTRQDRLFRIGLFCAALLHSLILVGALVDTGEGRRMGEPDASPEGVSVIIMDEADLKSRTTVPAELPAAPPPRPQAQPQPQPQQPQQQQEPSEPETQPPQVQERAEPQARPQTPPPSNPDAPGDAQPSQPRPTQKPSKQAAARPANPSPPTRPTLNLNIDPGPSFMSRGGSFAPTRPPGITRSGENDEFGRGVIRALQRTVPQLVNTVGRVTVRIILNSKGNLASVEVLRPSGVGNIDQSVVFAVKQASFPIPPDNATDVDRTFYVTYIFSVY